MSDGTDAPHTAYRAALIAAAPYTAFMLAVPLVAHLMFSRLGFNPTDDGFVLAYARRMLDGQIPHRDFIAIHLAGSGLVHMPFVVFGGNRTYLISRFFVWIELAWTALAWTLIGRTMLSLRRNAAAEICIALTAFALSAHYFPVMAWHTIDGLFFAAGGILLCLQSRTSVRLAGYFLIGVAVLCKQSYIFMAPAAVLLLGRGREWRAWMAVAVPGFVYAAVVTAGGGFRDAVLQLTAQTGLGETGFLKYYWEYATGWGMLFGYLAMRLLNGAGHIGNNEKYAAVGGIAAVLLASSFALAQGQVLNATAFGLFGMTAGAMLYFPFEGSWRDAGGRFGALSALAMWCASLSIGYNTPALACGFAAVYLLLMVSRAPVAWPRPLIRLAIPGLALISGITLFEFYVAREQYIYLEQPASTLTYSLDGVFPGADGILTDKNTYAFLVDLDDAVHEAGSRYAILPDLAGYWAAAPQANPLPTDWAQWFELATPPNSWRASRKPSSPTAVISRLSCRKFAPLPWRADFFRLPIANITPLPPSSDTI